jgi:hypothetical protein
MNENDVRDKSPYSQVTDASSTCLPSSVDALTVDIMSSLKMCRADSSAFRALRSELYINISNDRSKDQDDIEIMRSVADMADRRPVLAGGPPSLFQMRVALVGRPAASCSCAS